MSMAERGRVVRDALHTLRRAVDVGAVGVLSPPRRTSGAPHEGHAVGTPTWSRRAGRPVPQRTGPTTSGMTSPALRTITVSPGRKSCSRTWSSLCRRGPPRSNHPRRPARGPERRRPAGATDRDDNVEELGGALLGRELVRDHPARRLRGGTQGGVQRQLVDLHHRAVDLVVQVVALGGQFLAAGDDGG